MYYFQTEHISYLYVDFNTVRDQARGASAFEPLP